MRYLYLISMLTIVSFWNSLPACSIEGVPLGSKYEKVKELLLIRAQQEAAEAAQKSDDNHIVNYDIETSDTFSYRADGPLGGTSHRILITETFDFGMGIETFKLSLSFTDSAGLVIGSYNGKSIKRSLEKMYQNSLGLTMKKCSPDQVVKIINEDKTSFTIIIKSSNDSTTGSVSIP